MAKENQLKEKIEELEAELEKFKQQLNEPEGGRWKPEVGEKYWGVSGHGTYINNFSWSNYDYDKFHFWVIKLYHSKSHGAWEVGLNLQQV